MGGPSFLSTWKVWLSTCDPGTGPSPTRVTPVTLSCPPTRPLSPDPLWLPVPGWLPARLCPHCPWLEYSLPQSLYGYLFAGLGVNLSFLSFPPFPKRSRTNTRILLERFLLAHSSRVVKRPGPGGRRPGIRAQPAASWLGGPEQATYLPCGGLPC